MNRINYNPKISIIVPVYNVELYLNRCINSILAQTFIDYELILIDDGSTDSSSQICDKYAEQNSKIKVIHKKNGGLASARNIGIKKSNGKYIVFCDSDDYVSPFWCENFMKYESEIQTSFVFCEFNLTGKISNSSNHKKGISHKRYSLSNFFELQANNRIGFAWNGCYSAEIIKKNKIFFPENIIVEDLPFILNYVSHMQYLFSTGKYDYNYYQDDRITLSRKYYDKEFKKWQQKYKLSDAFIKQNIAKNEQNIVKKTLADFYLYPFLHSLNNTFDARNTMGLKEKIIYNNSVVKSSEFQDCLAYADCSVENWKYIWLLKRKLYFGAYFLQLLSKLKGDK